MSFITDEEDNVGDTDANRIARDYERRLKVCNKIILNTIDPNYDLYYNKVEGNIIVIRDDNLCGGTKSRFLASSLPFDQGYTEFVYVSSHYGGAQVALAVAIRQLNMNSNKKYRGTIFTTPFSSQDLPTFTKMTRDMGVKIMTSQDPHGDAIEYVETRPQSRFLLPNGLALSKLEEHLTLFAKKILEKFGKFDLVCSAIGSGTLTRSLQRAGLANRYIAIGTQGGHAYNYEGGEADVIVHDQEFGELVPKSDEPPFTSALWYDAKAWKYIMDVYKESHERKPKLLFWNVM